MRLRWDHIPARLVTGAYVLHSGWTKLWADEDTVSGLYGMATTAYPVFERVPAPVFVRALGVGEMGLGALLLAPTVPSAVAGPALTVFSGSLVGMYAQLPGMREDGSIWPTQQGMALAKDAWLVGIGLTMTLGGLRPGKRKSRVAAGVQRLRDNHNGD